MNKLLVLITFALFTISYAAPFTNPVLPGDNPDLNIFRDGDDYYIIGSCFHMRPHLEIRHSRDLVHWEVYSRVIKADWNESPDTTEAWGGFICKFGGYYWVYSSIGNQHFMKATSLKGPWSEPVSVTEAHGYDNSVFVDDDGKIYMVMKSGHGEGALNKLQEIGSDGQLTGTAIDLSWINLEPNVDWAEGPTMCKHNGYYYYFASTNTGCYGKEYCWRSNKLSADWLTGPHLAWLCNGEIHHIADLNIVQAPIEGPDGNWYVFYHSYEKNWVGLGRTACMARVNWIDDVPSFGDTPVFSGEGPDVPSGGISWYLPVSDEFSKDTLGPWWLFYGKTSQDKYSLTDRPGWLRIKPGTDNLSIVQKAALHANTMVVQMDFTPSKAGDEAGLRLSNGANDFALTLSKVYNNGVKIRFAYEGTNHEIPWDTSDPVWLKLKKTGHIATGWISTDRTTWTQVGTEFNTDSLDQYAVNGNSWVGNFNGIYASNKTADFDNFSWRDGFDIIRGGDFQNQLGIQRIETDSSSLAVNIGNGDWALYGRIDLGTAGMNANSFLISVATPNDSGTVELRLDEPTGELIGTCQTASTGGIDTWKTFACAVNGNGVHDLYLCFKGITDSLFKVKEFLFKQETISTYYLINATASAGGSISQNPTGSSLAQGTQVTFSVVPNTEWKFAGWSGDYTGTDSVYTISSLNSDVTLNASFIPVNPYLYEAEYAQLHDVTVISSSPGYSGTGYADFGGVGSYIELPVYVSESGEKVFTITYANGGGVDRGVSVAVNGTEVTSLLNFPATGGWANWKTVHVSLNLEQGINVIKLTTVTDAGGPNVDKLEIDPVRALRDIKEMAFGVKYNPAKFTVQAYKPGADLKVVVYSINGKMIFSRKVRLGSSAAVTGLPVHLLTNGSYLLETSLDGVTDVRRIQIVR